MTCINSLMPNQIITRKDLELETLVKEIQKTDKILNDFEIVLTKLRNYKDKSNSVRLTLALDMLKDYETIEQIEQE